MLEEGNFTSIWILAQIIVLDFVFCPKFGLQIKWQNTKFMVTKAQCSTDMIVLAWPFFDFQACFLQGFLLGRFHATLYKAVGNQNKSVIRLIARAAAILHKSFFNAPSRMKDCPLHSTHGKSQVSIFSNLNALNFVSTALYLSPPFDERQTVQNLPKI